MARRGPAGPRLAASRVVYAVQVCGGRPAPTCAVELHVLRLADGRRFARARFARTGPVAGLTVSPRRALAVMLAARCRQGRRAGPPGSC